MKDKLLTIKDIQERLQVSRCTVLHWIRSGELKAVKLPGGRLWRVREHTLQKFISN